MIQIGVLDNEVSLAKMLAHFIDTQPGLHCSFYVSTMGELLNILEKVPDMDIILLDVELDNGDNGLAYLSDIKRKSKAKIIVVTGHNKENYLELALRHGASGVFLKGSGLPKLAEAIREVVDGGVFISGQAASLLTGIIQKTPTDLMEVWTEEQLKTKEIIAGLNAREYDVLVRLVQGKQYEEIGKEMYISINTVRHYVKILYNKFDVPSKVLLSNKLRNLL
jgi:DNA-binding NarL/FixJ family response regulator